MVAFAREKSKRAETEAQTFRCHNTKINRSLSFRVAQTSSGTADRFRLQLISLRYFPFERLDRKGTIARNAAETRLRTPKHGDGGPNESEITIFIANAK